MKTEDLLLKTQVEIWRCRAQAHEENYQQMLKRVDGLPSGEIIAPTQEEKEDK